MRTYHVYIGTISFGNYTVKNLTELYKQVKEEIEELHPLNSSEEGREIYRNRFRNQPIFHREIYTENWYNEEGKIVKFEEMLFNIN